MTGFERYCERHHERPMWRNRLCWFYGNTPVLYKPVLFEKYDVFYKIRRKLCRHAWEESGHWAEGKMFVETMWYCPRCHTGRAFPMSDRICEQFFGENGLMRNIKLVEGSISDVLKDVLGETAT